jgi:hypothetical protein
VAGCRKTAERKVEAAEAREKDPVAAAFVTTAIAAVTATAAAMTPASSGGAQVLAAAAAGTKAAVEAGRTPTEIETATDQTGAIAHTITSRCEPLDPEPLAPKPWPYTLNPKPSTLSQNSNPNPDVKSSTLGPRTLNPKP